MKPDFIPTTTPMQLCPSAGLAINTASLMKGVAIFMKIKFRNVDTGEIIEIDEDDFEAFDECMSHKNYQLIFD